jgi:hypothetical protein
MVQESLLVIYGRPFPLVADRFDFESLVRIQLGLIPEYLAMEV